MSQRLTVQRWSGDLPRSPRDQRVDDVIDTAVFAVAVLLLVLVAVL
jgi:hypothetical protein